nr:unnamed protein product [Callosobruchus analis]
MNDLNTKGECALTSTLTEGTTATHLKICCIRLDPSPVMDYQVPIFVKELPEQQWDLTPNKLHRTLMG